jgi:hypothetical protein
MLKREIRLEERLTRRLLNGTANRASDFGQLGERDTLTPNLAGAFGPSCGPPQGGGELRPRPCWRIPLRLRLLWRCRGSPSLLWGGGSSFT